MSMTLEELQAIAAGDQQPVQPSPEQAGEMSINALHDIARDETAFGGARLTGMDKLAEYGAKLVFTSRDGSQVLQLPNGSMQVLNEQMGYSSSNPAVADAIMKGAPLEAIIRRGESEHIMQTTPGKAVASQFVEKFPFMGSSVGEIGEEVFGIENAAQNMDRMAAAFRETNPKTATGVGIAGSITGGLLQAIPASKLLGGKKIFDAIMRMPSWKKYLTLASSGAGITGAEDIIYRAGTPNEAGERLGSALDELTQAAVPAAIGGGANVLLPLIGSGLALGWANVRRGLLNSEVKDIMKEFGVSKEAATVIRDTFRDSDELDVLLNNISRAGDKGMIADADSAAAAILDTVIAVDTSAGRIASQAVEQRATQAGQELGQVMDEAVLDTPRILGKQGESMAMDTVDYAKQIADATRPQRQEAYNKFYQTPIDYAAPTGRAIEAALSRIDADLMQKAIKEANAEMKRKPELAGTRHIMANIDENGDIVFVEMPNAIQLDYIKRALGDVGYSKAIGQDAFGEMQQRRAREAYFELNKAIGDASPDYRIATNLGGDKIARERALEIGQEVTNPNVSPREFYRMQEKLTDGQRLYMRAGLRSTIEDTMNKARATIASPDVDITALRNTLRLLSDKGSQNKMKTVLGSKNADKLYKQLDRLQAALDLRAMVAQNSKTAQRLAVKGRVEELTEGGSLEALAMGRPLEATQRAVQAAAGVTKGAKQEQQSQILRELAKAMTEKKGEAAQQGMRVIYDAVRKNVATDADYQKAFEFMIDSVKLPTAVFAIEGTARGQMND